MQHLEHLRGFYNFIDLELDDCPVRFSVVLPSERAIAEWTHFPIAALPRSGRVANGRGLTHAGCHASGLGEAVELASCCAWGDEPLVFASASQLGPRAISSKQVLGLTSAQYDARDTWNAEYAAFDWRPKPCHPASIVPWVEVADAYSGEPLLAPADAILIGRREAGDEAAVAIGDSNGCASGSTLEAAKVAAILELIERDALARWWYGRRGRPVIRSPVRADHTALGSHLASRRRTCSVFDITTDTGIPAFAAVSAEPSGSDVAIGSAAALAHGEAVLSAITEMLQMEITLEIVRETSGAPATWGRWRRDVTMDVPPLSASAPVTDTGGSLAPGDRSEGLRVCLDACAAAGISLFFIELTRPELGVPAVRALSTDLCHFKPRFGRRRLLAEDSRDGARTDDALETPNPVLLLV
ncbi:hypothetical protein BH10PSE7_BH10PSE7_14180 [soil metagenome]